MKVGDYVVTTKQLRPGLPVEIESRPVCGSCNRAKALNDATLAAARLAAEGHPYCVEVHRVLELDDGGVGAELVCDFCIEDRSGQIEDALDEESAAYGAILPAPANPTATFPS
jgi:hypothetical protein